MKEDGNLKQFWSSKCVAGRELSLLKI
jgi:hypothetical protein